MTRRWICTLVLISSPAWAMLQAPETKDNIDIGSLVNDKKPCDGDKKKPDAAPKPASGTQAPNTAQAVQGMIQLGTTPAEKQEPKPKSLGALPGPMENCK